MAHLLKFCLFSHTSIGELCVLIFTLVWIQFASSGLSEPSSGSCKNAAITTHWLPYFINRIPHYHHHRAPKVPAGSPAPKVDNWGLVPAHSYLPVHCFGGKYKQNCREMVEFLFVPRGVKTLGPSNMHTCTHDATMSASHGNSLAFGCPSLPFNSVHNTLTHHVSKMCSTNMGEQGRCVCVCVLLMKRIELELLAL